MLLTIPAVQVLTTPLQWQCVDATVSVHIEVLHSTLRGGTYSVGECDVEMTEGCGQNLLDFLFPFDAHLIHLHQLGIGVVVVVLVGSHKRKHLVMSPLWSNGLWTHYYAYYVVLMHVMCGDY